MTGPQKLQLSHYPKSRNLNWVIWQPICIYNCWGASILPTHLCLPIHAPLTPRHSVFCHPSLSSLFSSLAGDEMCPAWSVTPRRSFTVHCWAALGLGILACHVSQTAACFRFASCFCFLLLFLAFASCSMRRSQVPAWSKIKEEKTA